MINTYIGVGVLVLVVAFILNLLQMPVWLNIAVCSVIVFIIGSTLHRVKDK
jgi:hypothetical protein